MKYVIMKMDERIKYMFGMGTNYLNILLKYPFNWIQLNFFWSICLLMQCVIIMAQSVIENILAMASFSFL